MTQEQLLEEFLKSKSSSELPADKISALTDASTVEDLSASTPATPAVSNTPTKTIDMPAEEVSAMRPEEPLLATSPLQETAPISQEEALKKAQDSSALGKLSALLGEGLAKTGTGYASGHLGAKPIDYDKTSFEESAKLGNIPLENLLQARAEGDKQAQREKLALDFRLQKDKNDATSETSKTFADMVQKVFDANPDMKGTNVLGMSQAAIEAVHPFTKDLESYAAKKLQAAELADRLKTTKEEKSTRDLKQNVGKFSPIINKTKALDDSWKDLNDWMENHGYGNLEDLEKAGKDIPGVSIPLLGRKYPIGESQEFFAKLTPIVNAMAHEQFGSRQTPTEIKRLALSMGAGEFADEKAFKNAIKTLYKDAKTTVRNVYSEAEAAYPGTLEALRNNGMEVPDIHGNETKASGLKPGEQLGHDKESGDPIILDSKGNFLRWQN